MLKQLSGPAQQPIAAIRGAPMAAGRTACHGFSMVELLVALLIGLLLLLGLTDLLVDSKFGFLREAEFARVQENGRMAMLGAARHLRRARSLGCRSIARHDALGSLHVKACQLLDLSPGESCAGAAASDRPHLLAPERALGYDSAEFGSSSWLADLPAVAREQIGERWLRGDVLVTWGVGEAATGLRQPVNADRTGRLQIRTAVDGLSEGGLALISDCVASDVFEITGPDEDSQSRASPFLEHGAGGGSGGGNAGAPLSRAYDWQPPPAGDRRTVAAPGYPAAVYPLLYSAYFVCCVDMLNGRLQTGRDVDRCRRAASAATRDRYRPSLCSWDLRTARSLPIVNDIADLRVTFSGDADGDGVLDFFAQDPVVNPTAAWVSARRAWAGVRSAEVEVLVAGSDGGLAVTEQRPAKSDWPPNAEGAGALHPDTLGFALVPERRLYKRFALSVAMRARTPWTASP
jgi:prepilin-type N-terminal cleavage/methylation domain-containing protein